MRYLLSTIFCLWASCAWAFPPGFIGAVTQGVASGGTIPDGWTLQVSDDFTGSDGNLSSPWTVNGDNIPKISSNSLAPQGDNVNSAAYYSTAPSSLPQMACLKITSSAAIAGPAVRVQSDDTTRYDIIVNMTTSDFLVRRVVTDAASAISWDTIAVSIGDNVCLTATGTSPVTLQAFINGVLTKNLSDSESNRINTAGRPGVFTKGGLADDFAGYDQ